MDQEKESFDCLAFREAEQKSQVFGSKKFDDNNTAVASIQKGVNCDARSGNILFFKAVSLRSVGGEVQLSCDSDRYALMCVVGRKVIPGTNCFSFRSN